ncbi:MAG TPA: HAF repeat-containing protein [Candidatus Binatia bacterium]|jgi:probable HAF family extracellular repeat protein|nr:HAF repeat-containing protein [Candidatus Binatia bacterium]
MRLSFVLSVLLTTVFIRASADSPQYSVTDLGTLGGTDSYASAINNNGQIVGDSYTTNGLDHAFLYSEGRMIDLGTLGGTWSFCGAINNQGQVVGASLTSNAVTHAFLYDGATMTDLDTLNTPYSEAYSINDNGQAVGVVHTNQTGFDLAFLFSGGTMTSLGTLGGPSSQGYAINNNGQIVGSATTLSNGTYVFLYSGGVMSNVGRLGLAAFAYGVNNHGQIVGFCFLPTGANDAFFYDGEKMIDLAPPGCTLSQARGINDNGDVVGFAGTGFLYSGGTLRNLNDLAAGCGWDLRIPTAVNNKGQIVGVGFNPAGQRHGFLLTPLPSLHIEFNAALLISWPTNASGCALYQSPNAASTNWLPMTNTPTVTNGQYQIGISDLSAGQQFYRLICH